MQFTSLVLPILAPVLFWAAYHYYKDRHQPEPVANLLLCFFLGIGTSYFSILAYAALGSIGLRFDAYELAASSPGQLFVYAVFVIGGIEETAKMLPFLLFAIRFKAFDERIDGIIYASFIALGYAAMENYRYLQYLSDTEALYRGFAGPLVHIVFASIWGYFIGIAHIARHPIALTAFVSVTIAALFHGVYDFLVIAFPATALPLAAGLIVAIWIWRLVVIRRIKMAEGHLTR